MARSIPDAFFTFKSNLEITTLQDSVMNSRQIKVRDAIADELNVLDSFLSGSYRRQTLIAPLAEADIDVFVVLAPEYFHNYNGQNGGQAALIDRVKRLLKRTYPQTPDISRNGQAVTIRFSDFNVDLVPCFHRSGGGFLIPNGIDQRWISTNPIMHVEILQAADQSHNSDLVPMIKMIKAWNRSIGQYFNSFHLEVLSLMIFENITISDFSSGARFFFDKGIELITKKNPDPAGFHDDIGAYLNTTEKIDQARTRFETAFNRATRAERFANDGNIRLAIEEWQKIFTRFFPAYG